MSMSLPFVLATADMCGIDTFNTDKIESNSISLRAGGSGTPVKTGLIDYAPSYAWPDSREICYTNTSSESHIHGAS